MTSTIAERSARAAGPLAALLEAEDALLACVHCGFCLSTCPTYTRLGGEADSPRGRIYLMRAVAEGRLAPDAPTFGTHLDLCLGCRACETVCPSGVEYGNLLERGREVYFHAAGNTLVNRIMLRVFGSRWLGAVAWLGGRMARATGIPRMVVRLLPERFAMVRFGVAMVAATRPWKGLRDAGRAAAAAPGDGAAGSGNAEVPAQPGRAAAPVVGSGRPPAGRRRTKARPRIALLLGCVQDGLFGHVNRATARVLAANGCEIVEVKEQQCCGALHAHAGDLEGARELARANIRAFERAGVDFVVVNAAGCGAMMKDYGKLLADDPKYAERAAEFVERIRDVNEFMAALDLVRGATMALRITYDAPCHLFHAQRITDTPLDVLRRTVPGLEIVPLPHADECCGAAGIYGLTHPELGGRILRDKVAAVRSTGAQVVVTPNPGCMMQIGAGLLMAGADTRVLHPIELIDESYRRLNDGGASAG